MSFTLAAEQLGCWDVEANPARFTVEPGTFAVYIGRSLSDTQKLSLEIV